MINLDELSIEELVALDNELKQYEDTHRLEYYEPYPFQRDFIEAGAYYKQRFLRAGNRVGKTFTAAVELAFHLTGRYPEWWNGARVLDSGHQYWCIGVDLRQVRRVQQFELLGTMNAANTSEFGYKAIPRDAILLDTMERDGKTVKTIEIQHVDGGSNTLMFFAAEQGQDTLMGSSVKCAWIDEEHRHKSQEIYSQCLTRTATADGFIIFTATPEAGYTKLNVKFEEDDTGKLYLQQASMYDAHSSIGGHLTDDIIEELKAGWPEWQWDMRIYGKPLDGNAAVFPYEESKITFDPYDEEFQKVFNSPSTVINCGIDWGKNNDPTTMVRTILDKNTGIIYAISENEWKKSLYERTPEHLADFIHHSEYPNIQIMCPHDTGMKQTHEYSKAVILRQKGIYNLHANKLPEGLGGKNGNNSSIAIAPGIDKMRQMFYEGKLKISKECKILLKEMRGYSVIIKDGKEDFKGATGDHCIDALRLSVMGHLRYINSYLYTARNVGAEDPMSAPAPDWGNRVQDPQYEQTNFLVVNNGWDENIIY